MKLLNIKISVLLLTLMLSPVISEAQGTGSSESRRKFKPIERRWDKRENIKYSGWERLKPTQYKIQYAGGMGKISLALGWDYGHRNQWETDLHLGYIPNRHHSKYHLIFTLKQNYIPWSMSFGPHWNLEPFYCGLYFSTISGDDFWKKEPGIYPNKYYNMSTKIRAGIFWGQRLGFKDLTPSLKNLQLFYEFNTNELYIVSKFDNDYIKLKDIVGFSFGLRVQIYKENRFQIFNIKQNRSNRK